MVFSTILFLFRFLPITLALYYLAPAKLKNTVLFVCSLVFYCWGEVRFFPVMLALILINYLCGLGLERMEDKPAARTALLLVALAGSLGMLFYFKYANFVLSSLNSLFGTQFAAIQGISTLPLGISFYTFQTLSYTIDVYRREVKTEHNIIDFGAYVVMFPQLIAGPIVRYKDVNEQLVSRRETPTLFNSGVRLFVVGLAKKVLLANQFGMLWDAMSADPVAAGALGAWAGACAYTLQIYFDFAGYSDMARGLGRMLGFEFCINFNYPYISKSVTEFWRRWHISLSTWFRDYVYIPLGGNRCGKLRQCVNILVVWALTGFWHGAGWNFLFWGFYYGVLLLLEKLLLGKYIRRLPAVFQHLYAMVIVIIGWVFFASPDLSTALAYLQVMFSFSSGTMGGASLVMPWLGMAVIGVVAATPLAKNLWEKLQGKKAMPLVEGALCLAALLLCTASLVSDSYNPFLYFRF